MVEQRWTQDPEPATRGNAVTICFNFTGSGVTTETATVTSDPADADVDGTHEVKDENGKRCFTITPGANTVSVQVESPHSEDFFLAMQD